MRFISGYTFLLMLFLSNQLYAQKQTEISTPRYNFIVKSAGHNDSTHTTVATLEIYDKVNKKLLQQSRIDHLLNGHKDFHHIAMSDEVGLAK